MLDIPVLSLPKTTTTALIDIKKIEEKIIPKIETLPKESWGNIWQITN